MFSSSIKSLFDLQQAFPTEQSCIDYLELIIWNGKPVSPFDPESKVYKCKNNRYRCSKTGKDFNIKTKSCFENTKIPLRKWMFALWLMTNSRKGITSVQLAKSLGITQSNAWFLAHRIRACFKIENNNELEGEIETDEAFYGGLSRWKHKNKREKNVQGRDFKTKVPVLTLMQRADVEKVERPHKLIPDKTVIEKVILAPSKATVLAIPNTKRETIQPLVLEYVRQGSRLVSDEWGAYNGMDRHYRHDVVDHSKKEYVNLEDNSRHTNNVEGSWRIMKNCLKGTYLSVSRKHIQAYLDEHTFRWNLKEDSTGFRFDYLLKNTGVRTKYKDLIA